jgi:hypothetical protein
MLFSFSMKLRSVRQPRKPKQTTLTFSADDLTVLARLIAAGQIMVPTAAAVLPRLKAALTRLGVAVPKGL